MDSLDIGKKIKDIRIKNHLTQQEFADIFGVTYQAVSKWENGKNIPDISILKAICLKYNLDINDFLGGKKSNKNKWLWFFIFLVVIVVLVIWLLFFHSSSFVLKPLSSSCSDFEIIGSMAYNPDKSSIYISKIDYCGKQNDELYKSISCTLYENHDNGKVKIDDCPVKENVTLEQFLENISFYVTDYKTTCKNYKDNLEIEIESVDNDGNIKTYKVPLKLDDNCNSTES